MYAVILKAHSCHCVSHKNRSFAGDLVQFISSSVLFPFFVDQITFQKIFDRIIFIFPFKIKLVLKVKCIYLVKIFPYIKREVVWFFFSALFHCVPPSNFQGWDTLFCKMWRTYMALWAISVQHWGLSVHLGSIKLLIQPKIVYSSKRGTKYDLAQNL